jgi:hypothetical protein
MATLPSSGPAPNLDVAKQRANEALMEAQQYIERVRKLRSVPGLLGLPTAILEATQAFERLTMALGALMLGDDNDVYRTYLEDRLANQIRGNGD